MHNRFRLRACVLASAGAVMAISLLVGCTNGAAPESTRPTMSSSPSTVATSTSSTTEPQPATTATEPDTFGEFVPPPPPIVSTPPDVTEQLGPYADLVLGAGTVLRGSKEHLDYLVSCIAAGGFSVELDPSDGSMTANPGAAQMDNYIAVHDACRHAAIDYGLVDSYAPPSDAELELWYRAYLITQDCLIEHGYPTTEQSSLEVYVQSGGAAWHPYNALIRTTSEWEVEPVCSQDLVKLVVQLVESEQ